MAAEKLTKGRLIQILFIMAVLITAFTWRTITYEEMQSINNNKITCELTADKCISSDQKTTFDIALNPYPATANSELIIQFDNTVVKPSATVEGVTMYMGTIPVVFNKTTTGWQGKFIVPICTHTEMQWAATIIQGKKTIIATFTVKK
ncbi:hypothetical protein [Photobacterium nomapromontoriensis]|uniref:hypothetical protein n=1 Tax=Photobacterium nomapromontoriensis TaxID=2910237 RepID=UPI003D13DF20